MVYTISIGSNEQRTENLSLARKRLKELFPGIRFSTEEETKPLFFSRPSLFSNQVARFDSGIDVSEITSRLKAIEQEAGRKPEEKKQEIVKLDIDLLSCDSKVYKPDDLKRDYILRALKQLEQPPRQSSNRK